MSETMRLLMEAHQTIRTLVGRLDGAESMLAKSDDTAHALKEEVARLRADAEELAKVDKRWEEAMRDTAALVDAVTCALDVAGIGNPADVPAERVRWAQRDLEAIKADAERLKKERDEALERLKQKDAKPEVTTRDAKLRIVAAWGSYSVTTSENDADVRVFFSALGDWLNVALTADGK